MEIQKEYILKLINTLTEKELKLLYKLEDIFVDYESKEINLTEAIIESIMAIKLNR
jgi:hypothetical protein